VDGLRKDAIQLFCAPKPRPGKIALKNTNAWYKKRPVGNQKRGTIDIEH
jgi:hypothetical protein